MIKFGKKYLRMNNIKRFYNKILKTGQYKEFSLSENKRVKLLNYYALLGMHFAVILPIADVINEIITIYFLYCYGFMFLSMCLVVWLNKIKRHKLACYLWLSNILFTVFLFSNYLFPQSYNEYYLVFMPGLALTLFPKSKIPIAVFVLSFFLFLVPYFILSVYVYSIVAKLDVFAIFGIFICIYMLFNYFNNNNIKNEIKLQKAYVKLEETKKTELTNLRLKLLRGKMNPHFMFNAMNSIQNLVIKGDTIESYKYLSKFSEIIRGNLKMSEKTYVFLEDECSLLEKYLEIEKLRFQNSIEYTLEKVNVISGTQIPSMVIQPFMENALHRMFHESRGVKNIEVQFTQDESLVTCVILDTGVSFKEMKVLQKDDLEKSFSLDNIDQHLGLLLELFDIDISYLYEVKGEQTVCSIKIPFKK